MVFYTKNLAVAYYTPRVMLIYTSFVLLSSNMW